MNHKNTENNGAHNEFDGFDLRACSANDCTGLIPALPSKKDELENYEEMYRYLTKAQVKNDFTK